MIVIIQDAEGRRPDAGHLTARNGNRVLFVADPAQAPERPGVCHVRPDAFSSFGATWRQLVHNYNANPRNNPLGLLPAHALYPDTIYTELVDALGPERCYVLSAAWGLVRASFLTPNYDITLDAGAEPFRRRSPADRYADFRLLPADGDEELYLFANPDYVPLFCRLTAGHARRRVVFHRSAEPPEAPGCELRRIEAEAGDNWHHACARAFLAERRERRQARTTPAPRVSNIEARLRATMQRLATVSRPLAEGLSEADTRAARSGARQARNQAAGFEWLTQALHRTDVRTDDEFQQRFEAFHGIGQRSKDWRDTYYRLLEQSKTETPAFPAVLDALWQQTGRYEPQYSSRLIATADPSQPVWDRFALMNAGLRAPSWLDSDKLSKAADLYRQLGRWYRSRLATPGGKRIVELFDEQLPGHESLHSLKKLEFVLRHMRAGQAPLRAAGRTKSTSSPV